MVLEAGKLYKKVGDSFVEVNTEEYVAPALTDALELQQASDAPIPTAQAFLTTLALNNLTIQNYSGNVTPVEGDTKQISDSGQIRFYRYTSGAWVEVGGFNGNNLQFKNDGKNNIIMGYNGPDTSFGSNSAYEDRNVVIGDFAGRFLKGTSVSVYATDNVYIGTNAGKGAFDTNGGIYNGGTANVGIGSNALSALRHGNRNVAMGYSALSTLHTGDVNVAVGSHAMWDVADSDNNVAVGNSALQKTTGPGYNVAIGTGALVQQTTGYSNTAIGYRAGTSITTGRWNTSLGYESSRNSFIGDQNTALGAGALSENYGFTHVNCMGLGAYASVTGANQNQIGNSSTTTYVFGTVQNRSDIRDKADIRDTELGLDFILKLRPVDYKWDMREDYITRDDEGNVTKLPKDGSKKRSRYHHGFIAQEVKTIIDETSKDFGGFQDHSVKGGQDVMSIGYDEFIAPMVKAMQEMNEQIKALREEVITLRERVATLEGVSE